MKYYRVTYKPNVDVTGKRRFWLQVTKESADILIGWELDAEGERTHRQHVMAKALIVLEPATMNYRYATLEILTLPKRNRKS